MPKVAVVTDSSATLPAEVAAAHGILVVPLQVVIGAHSYADGVDPEAAPERVAEALEALVPVSTSRPTPSTFLEVYRAAAAQGADEVVSVHLSSEVSGTVDSASLAAREAPLPVHVVDTRQIGPATGFAALTAAETAARGGPGTAAAAAARARSAASTSLFYVDTLEYLRRGGRVGAAAALLGSALAMKPILEVADGRVTPREKVRTSARALARLEELAVAAGEAAPAGVDVAVAHLAAETHAVALADRLARSLSGALGRRTPWVTQVPAVVGAHVGPGLVGVTISPRPSPPA